MGMDREGQKRIVEALVLGAPEPVSAQKMAEVVPGLEADDARALVAELGREYEEQGRAFEIWGVAGGGGGLPPARPTRRDRGGAGRRGGRRAEEPARPPARAHRGPSRAAGPPDALRHHAALPRGVRPLEARRPADAARDGGAAGAGGRRVRSAAAGERG